MTPSLTPRERILRDLRVHLNFVRVVVPQFRASFAIFSSVVVLGGLAIWLEPDTQPHSFPHALYTALALIFFEVSEPYPEAGGPLVQAAYFLLPMVGLFVVAEAVLRFGVLMFNRKHLSEEWQMALASSFKDHVVIVGLGRIGKLVLDRLARTEKRIACIERDRLRVESLGLPPDIAVIVGEASQAEVLAKANARAARAILVLTDNDLANLEVALNARELNPSIRVVLRMFNEKLGERLIKQFGFEAVYSTPALAAPSFASALYSGRILQTIDVGEGRSLHMATVHVAPASTLVGKTILEVERSAGVSVLLHKARDGASHSLLPSVEDRVGDGDDLYVLAELERVDAFDRLARGD